MPMPIARMALVAATKPGERRRLRSETWKSAISLSIVMPRLVRGALGYRKVDTAPLSSPYDQYRRVDRRPSPPGESAGAGRRLRADGRAADRAELAARTLLQPRLRRGAVEDAGRRRAGGRASPLAVARA